MPASLPRICLLLSTVVLASGQNGRLTFEVASVKPTEPPKPDGRGMIQMTPPSGGPGTPEPGRIHYPYATLRYILVTAYDVKSFQIVGPTWINSELYDVTATMPPDTTKEQFRTMLQNLLADRFKVTLHRESKELPMYSLVVAKSGSKLKETADTGPVPGETPPPLPPTPKMGPDGFPVMPPGVGRNGIAMIMMNGRARMFGIAQTMPDLASRLGNQLNRPVTDATGLTGKYDFTLTFAPEGMMGPGGPLPPPPPGAGPAGPGGAVPAPPAADDPLPDLFSALQSQLGLRLDAKKGPVEMIVIDRAEKTPSEN